MRDRIPLPSKIKIVIKSSSNISIRVIRLTKHESSGELTNKAPSQLTNCAGSCKGSWMREPAGPAASNRRGSQKLWYEACRRTRNTWKVPGGEAHPWRLEAVIGDCSTMGSFLGPCTTRLQRVSYNKMVCLPGSSTGRSYHWKLYQRELYYKCATASGEAAAGGVL